MNSCLKWTHGFSSGSQFSDTFFCELSKLFEILNNQRINTEYLNIRVEETLGANSSNNEILTSMFHITHLWLACIGCC